MASESVKQSVVYVAADGNDKASGEAHRPVATVGRALAILRAARKKSDSPLAGKILLRGGRHFLKRPIVITPADSGGSGADRKGIITDPPTPLVIASAPGEKAVLSGGRAITGWKPTTVNGVTAWAASVPGARSGRGAFSQLWVNGRRALRTRLPEKGLFVIEEALDDPRRAELKPGNEIFRGHSRFRFADSDLALFHNLEDVEFVALHFWIESRIPFSRIDPQTRTAELAWRSRMPLTDDFNKTLGAPYYVENVREALHRPGQWYLDRPAGKVFYIPRKGERIETIDAVAPVLEELLRFDGDAENAKPVSNVRLENLTFSYNEYHPTAEASKSTPQAACHVPGAIVMKNAVGCAIVDCHVEHVGSYAIEITDRSMECEISGCTLRDLAAGGVKVFHRRAIGPTPGLFPDQGRPDFFCQRILIADNHIHDGGHRHRQAVGVLAGRCSGVRILHNHIHDLDYSGISVGWVWGYASAETFGNIIEYNHIHHIGRGVLSDMGAIYTLSSQPGTRIRFNLIHDVESRGYGGWGIYPDEGSSHILIENNLVYRTKFASYHQHYGKDNLVRNNIFALARLDNVALGRHERHTAFTFERNIVYTEQALMFSGGYNAEKGAAMPAEFDYNLYFCATGQALNFGSKEHPRSFRQWQALGRDGHSLLADPLFVDPANLDFRLKEQSPAIDKLGFVPFDLSEVGPRPRRLRK